MEHKGGKLHGDVLKSFFAISGSPGNFKHPPGMERIPYNSYKRPSLQPMNTVDTNVNTANNDGMYPGLIRFGGNTGKTNSFVGMDLGDLTSNAYNGATLLEGNNLSCFFLQATQAGLLDAAGSLLLPIGQIRSLLQKSLSPGGKGLGCPQLKSFFNQELFKKYPGASYFG